MKRISFFLAVMLSIVAPSSAAAQDVKPTVVPAPLELRRKPASLSKKDTEQVINEFERLVRAAGARIPTPSEVKLAIDGLATKDFASSDEDLAKLARKAQTLYAVHLQLDYPVTGTVVGVGRVVRADGKRMTDEVRVERSPESRPYLRATTETVIAVLEKLDLQRLPSAMPVATALAAPAAPAAPPAAALPQAKVVLSPAALDEAPVATGKKGKVVGGVVAGLGAAVAITGIVMLSSGINDASKLRPDARQYLPYDQQSLYNTAKQELAYGAGFAGVGAAVVLTGGLIWFLSGKNAPASVAVVPTSDGLRASVAGTF